MIEIRTADSTDVDVIARMFDRYRVFYNQASEPERGREFVKARLNNEESVIFVAFDNEQPVGFTQLYTTFSSVTMQPMFILNDLYVEPDRRNQGVGAMLLEKAKQLCIEKGYKGIELETARDNPAQKLYEREGWEESSRFLHYFWKAP